MRIAFIGLGRMGGPMARNLARAGHDLTVYNRTRARADELSGAGARAADSPAQAAAGCEVALTMLSDDSAAEDVVFGEDGLLQGLPRGASHVSMSTISPDLSRRLSRAHAERGQLYAAAPVFGRPEAAEQAELYVIAAGPEEVLGRCAPVFSALGQRTFVVGNDPGLANVVKLAGNFLLASVIESLAEAFALARKSGVAADKLLEILAAAPLPAPAVLSYASLIAGERFRPAAFSLPLGLKDVGLALGAAAEAGVPMPLAELVRERLEEAVEGGLSDADWSALGALAARQAGLPPPPLFD